MLRVVAMRKVGSMITRGRLMSCWEGVEGREGGRVLGDG